MRLATLWDIMERFRLDKFIRAYQHASALNQTWQTTRQFQPGTQTLGMPKADHVNLLSDIELLENLLLQAGLQFSVISARSMCEAINDAKPLPSGEMIMDFGACLRFEASTKDLQSRLRDEFVTRYVLLVPPDKVSYYDPSRPLFGADVDTKFPSATYEIREAGKCFGLARYTATVFHLMRALEVAIRAIARCLQIPDPVKPAERNWGKVMKAIDDAAVAKRSGWLQHERDFFDASYLALDKIRSLWRNTTMHVENNYNEEEAKEILDSVSVFLRKIAGRLNEDGQPLA